MKISITLAVLTGTFETDLARADKATQKRMRSIKKEMENTAKAVGTAFAAIAGASALLIRNAINNADKLDEMAQRTGIAVETLSRLQLSAKLGAVELDTLQRSVGRLAVRQREYAEGNKEAVGLFDALGIAAQNADGSLRDADAVLKDLSRVFAALPDGADKTALAIQVFGRAGQELIPFLNLGPQKLEEFDRKADALGITISGNTAKAAGDFNDQLDIMILGVQGLATQVAAELLPDMLELTRAFQENATAGNGASEAAVNIANGIRGVVFVADKGFQFIKMLTTGIVGFTASVLEFLSTYTLVGQLATTADQRESLGNFAAVSLAGADEARQSILGNEPSRSFDFAAGEAEAQKFAEQAKRDLEAQAKAEEAANGYAEALKKLREEQAQGAAASAAGAAARRAETDAAREAAKAAEREAEAAKKLAEAQFEARQELVRIAAEERQEREAALKQGSDLVEDLKFELELMQMTNAERAKAIQLRGLDAEAVAKYGDEIAALNAQIEENIAVAEGMDVVRNATQGLFSDLMSGAKSAKDAFMDFVDGILEGIAQIVARNLTESLLGSFGSTGGGASGNGLASIFGAFFGGARAGGGSVNPNQAFLVGEQGPELFIPPVAGTIATNSQTRKMMGGTNVQQNITVVGTVDRRAADRLRIDAARNQQKALARSY